MEKFGFKKRGMELEEKIRKATMRVVGELVKTSSRFGKVDPEAVSMYNEWVDLYDSSMDFMKDILEHFDSLEDELIQANEDRRKMLRLLEELKEQTK